MDNLNTRNRFALGVVLIGVGLVFFVGSFGLLSDHIYQVLTSWPMILVAIGVLNLLKGKYLPAIVLFAVAAFFLMDDIFPGVDMRDTLRFWPLLLIVVGAVIILRRNRPYRAWEPDVIKNSEEYIDELALFGGGVSQIESQNFKGGKITAIFGGSEIHFTRSQLAANGATIDMVTVFGGTKIVVPRNWNVKVEMVSILGGFADKRLYLNNDTLQKNTLVIKGVAVFGGGELNNV